MISCGSQHEEKTVVRFDERAWRKMMLYTMHADQEISGLGVVEEIEGVPIVKDVFIARQKCSGARTELDQEHLSEIVFQKIQEGDLNFGSKLRCWWHSHNTMQAFHSTTDSDTVQILGQNAPYIISVVTNQKQEHDAWVSIFSPLKVRVPKISIELVHTDQDELSKQCADEVEKLVSVLTPATSYGYGYGGLYDLGDHSELDWEKWYKRKEQQEAKETQSEKAFDHRIFGE